MQESVAEYYGKTLTGSADLKTDACTTSARPADYLRPLFANIHDEVASTYYGCGLVLPPALAGARVLDLGSGSGRDCYLLAQLVGEQGEVVGVDMTQEQLAIANRHLDWHRERFGFAKSNVRFLHGYIEQLDALGLEPGSFDVVVSNCVLNLSTDKPAVLRQVAELLAPGGEFYFSDVYADRRLPDALRKDPVIYGECLGGALYWNDFENMARAAGFADPRLVEDRPLAINDAGIKAKLEPTRFFSATYRLFKIQNLEPACEDYGQAVRYRGGIEGAPHAFSLDKHHLFETHRIMPVCGNTWRMLAESRYAEHFDFFGDFSRHLGLYADCGGGLPFDTSEATDSAATVSDSAGGCCG